MKGVRASEKSTLSFVTRGTELAWREMVVVDREVRNQNNEQSSVKILKSKAFKKKSREEGSG